MNKAVIEAGSRLRHGARTHAVDRNVAGANEAAGLDSACRVFADARLSLPDERGIRMDDQYVISPCNSTTADRSGFGTDKAIFGHGHALDAV